MIWIKDAEKRHAVKSWVSLFLSIFIIVTVFIAVVENLLSQPNENFHEVGLRTFRMYTVLSNMLLAVTVALSIPFAVDGIRNRNYHLPRWIVNITFVSVTTIILTFLISLCALAPRMGLYHIMIEGGFLFLHTLVPLTAVILFFFINDYHNVKFKTCFLALIPVSLYAIAYVVMVIIIGEDKGGWRDHYHFLELMPWPFILIGMLLITFGIAYLTRVVHNRMHKLDKISTEKYYQENEKYNLPTIEDVIIKMANDNKQYDQRGEIIVPRRIIIMLEKKYNSGKPLNELCKLYISEYLK